MMNVEQVLQMVDEFALAMRDRAKDPAALSAAALNQQREQLRDAIRRLARNDPTEETAARVAELAITAASVDRTKTELTDGRPVTADHRDLREDGQQKGYIVLSPAERAKGFVRPVRRTYVHTGRPGPRHPLRPVTTEQAIAMEDAAIVAYEEYPESERPKAGRYWTQTELDKVGKGCGTSTTMGQSLAETYARDPGFYGGTFCVGCGNHFPVGADGEFVWEDGSRVGT